MAAPKITVEELRRRMDAGERFIFLDTRNPQAWAESTVMPPTALRVTLDNFEQHLPEIPKDANVVPYCT